MFLSDQLQADCDISHQHDWDTEIKPRLNVMSGDFLKPQDFNFELINCFIKCDKSQINVFCKHIMKVLKLSTDPSSCHLTSLPDC